MNFGVTGTGPRHYLRVWEHAVRRYGPSVVLIAFYGGNDLSDALAEARAGTSAGGAPRARPFGSALAAALGRLARRGGGAAPSTRFGWAAGGAENPLAPEALRSRGRAAGLSPEEVDRRLAAIPESLLAEARAYRINPFNFAEAIIDPESIRKNLMIEPGEESAAGWPAAAAALDTLLAGVAASGARAALLYLPPAVQLDSAYWWIAQAGFRLDERVVRDAPLRDRLAALARERGTPFIDLLEPLRAAHAARPGERLFFEQDGHWTSHGNTVVARAVASAMERQGLVSAASESPPSD
jgi:hypothetical protein